MSGLDQLKERIETRIGCGPPPDYLSRVASLTESIMIGHPLLTHRSWRLFNSDDLLSGTQVDCHEGAQWESVSLFGMMLRDAGVTRLNGPNRRSPEFLDATASFACDNGDFLFFSSDTSVWVFHHDGHEIERISSSYPEFEDKVVWPRSLELAGTELNDWETQLLGLWRPVESDTEDASLFLDLKHDLVLKEDRTAKLVFSDDEADETWHSNRKYFVFTLDGHEVPHTYRLDGDVLNITTTKFGDHTRYERANGKQNK